MSSIAFLFFMILLGMGQKLTNFVTLYFGKEGVDYNPKKMVSDIKRPAVYQQAA